VNRLIEIGEVEIHDKPVPLAALSAIIEASELAHLFRKVGPEQVELVAKTAGSRTRLAAAFDTTEHDLYREYFSRLANSQPLIEIPSSAAPVHEVVMAENDLNLSKLPFHPQHRFDGSCYISSAIDYTTDLAHASRDLSSFVTTSTSPGSSAASAFASQGLSVLAPLCFSLKMLLQPAWYPGHRCSPWRILRASFRS
jgi:hypothetical protein